MSKKDVNGVKEAEVKEVEVQVPSVTVSEARMNELIEKEAQLLKRKSREKKYWKRAYYRAKLLKEKTKDLKIVITDEEVEKAMKSVK